MLSEADCKRTKTEDPIKENSPETVVVEKTTENSTPSKNDNELKQSQEEPTASETFVEASIVRVSDSNMLCPDDIESEKCLLRSRLIVKQTKTDEDLVIQLQMQWVDGTSRSSLQGLMQYFMNSLK